MLIVNDACSRLERKGIRRPAILMKRSVLCALCSVSIFPYGPLKLSDTGADRIGLSNGLSDGQTSQFASEARL
jgi:hypothetical protein